MTVSLPDGVENATTPAQIEQAAKALQEVDAPQAIEPLARLNRRASGWLVILLGLAATLLLALAGFGIAASLTTAGVWVIATAINWYLRLFYPEWIGWWWAGWGVLTALWLWGDDRLRGLLNDKRFALLRAEFTLPGAIVLWPFRALAGALRLCVALGFLTALFALPLTALLTIARTWGLWRTGEVSRMQAELLTYAFAAGGIYLLFGLFIFSEWPHHPIAARSGSMKQRLIRFVVALLIASGLGVLVRGLSPVNQDLTGLAAGVIFFIVFLRFLGARSAGNPFDFTWARQIKGIGFTGRQIRFLKFTLFLLTLLGAGVVIMTVVEHWALVRLLLPLAWRTTLRHWYSLNVDARMAGYGALEPWIVGGITGIAASALALVYLTGWGIRLARPFAWPFFRLRGAAANLVARVRARLAIRAAIRHHRERNRRLVGKEGHLAICREHLARFESRLARLSYGRQWKYWWCPECRSDAKAITGICTMRGVFDQNMAEALRPEDSVLHINLLGCVGGQLPLPHELHEVCLAYVSDPHDVEAFTVTYQEFALRKKTLNLKKIRLVIDSEAKRDEQLERTLRGTFRG